MTRDVFAVDLDRIEKLLPRYAMEGPRYTSYPTAPVWGDGYGPSDFRRDLSRDDAQPGDGLSIYVHVPFCRSLCHFCACNRVITRNEALPVQFLETIEREVDTVREAVGAPRPVTQVHWGGGTPTHLTPEQVTRLHAAVTARFPVAEGAEISIE
ncbi:MAG: coproporphyrinogen III oxidase, partial [Myxococcota bacterium]|nr:coproporphyrinogen III oxidase [Myxococcota bacterium]